MKNPRIIIIAIALLPLQLLAQFTVRGQIVDYETHEAMPYSHIMLNNQTVVIADQTGFFEIKDIAQGIYQLKVKYVGYETFEKDIEVKDDVTLTIAIQTKPIIDEEVIVSASRISSKTPATYSNVDARMLKRDNKGADLPYLLQSTPSLVVNSDAGAGVGYTSMRIRGSDLTRINVTINGVPVNDAETHQVYFVDLPDLSSSVDNIQVQRGVGTSANGGAAFGASINIKTDDSPTEPSATVNSAAGSFGTLKNTLMFSTGRTKNGFNINGRLSKIHSNGYIDRALSDLTSSYVSASWVNRNNILKFIVLDGSEVTYQAWNGCPRDSLATNRTYNPSGMMLNNDGSIKGYYDNETDNYRQTYYQLHYAHSFSSSTTFTAALFTTTGSGYYENYRNDEYFSSYNLEPQIYGSDTIYATDLIIQNRMDNVLYGFNASLNHSSTRLNTVFGAGLNRFDGSHYGLVKWAGTGFPADYEWYRNKSTKTDFNVFAKATYTVTEQFNIFADIQFRHIDYRLQGNHDDLRALDLHPVFNFWNPKAGVYYSFNSRNSAYFSVAVSNRDPNREIYTDSDEEQLSHVTSERLTDYELGYSFSSTKANLTANLFFMDYDDQLVLTGQINNVGADVMVNVDDSYRAGMETVFGYKINSRINFDCNLSLSRNKIKKFSNFVEEYDSDWNYLGQTENVIENTDISFSPNVIGGLNVNINIIQGLTASVHERYVGRQYIDNTSTLSRSLDPYHTTGISLNYQCKQNVFNDLTFNLSISNLFNKMYCSNAWVYRAMVGGSEFISDGYFPQAGISFMFGINIEI